MKPWQILAKVPLREGSLELRQRGDAEFLITIGSRVLMTSVARHSEESLSRLGCAPLAKRRSPRILIGGLGMGFTLRAALDALPRTAQVVVAELNPAVVEWCRGPLSQLTRAAIDDPRVQIEIGDVSRVIATAAPGSFDAILLDLYEGPHAATQRASDPFYGRGALLRTFAALSLGGVFAVWSEDADPPFAQRLSDVGFAVSRHREGQGGRTHFVYLGERPEKQREGRRPEKPDAKKPYQPTWQRRAEGSRTSRRESPRPT